MQQCAKTCRKAHLMEEKNQNINLESSFIWRLRFSINSIGWNFFRVTPGVFQQIANLLEVVEYHE